ncbi:MAG: 4Fe-4S binding protein [Bacillota bacterium]
MKRKIVFIDEEKCNGCGLCIPACHEGAIQIIDGKARLVADKLCDGLGDCLGECPEGAITIDERDAEAYDEAAVEEHLAGLKRSQASGGCAAAFAEPNLPCACPSSQVKTITRENGVDQAGAEGYSPSFLSQWPVQLGLVQPQAKFLQGADLLIAADCVPFAFGDFHRRFLKGKSLVIACPKLDDIQAHLEKLAAIFKTADIRSVHVIIMEVHCCSALKRVVEMALDYAGKKIPLQETVISITGEIKA